MRAELVHRGTLSEKAYLLLRNKILKGELPLGSPLSRRKLAIEFDMSFLPVSEALRRLESEGLVESRPRVGTRVRVPTAQDLRDRYIVREALETQSARLFCEKASSAERHEIRSMAERLERMIADPPAGEEEQELQYSIQALHVDFHMRIAECTGCGPLIDLLEKSHLLIFNWFYDVSAGSKIAPQRHRQLAEIIAAKDPDAAALEMGRHVRYGMQEIEEGIAGRFRNMLSQTPQEATERVTPWRVHQGERASGK
ncbi:MAG: GntR family transcriptional regulator [Bryobacteraceae bacterium]